MDAIIGAVDNYNWSKINNWAKSIRMSGFDGDIHLIIFRVNVDDINDIMTGCSEHKITIWNMSDDHLGRSINHSDKGRDTQSHQMRFYAIWRLLKHNITERYRFVIVTDVRDVIFQKNPSDYLNGYRDKYRILAPSESITFGNESWNHDNVTQAFGKIVADTLAGNVVCNVGTIAGPRRLIEELSLTIYLMGVGHYIPNDQAAFNVLVHGILKPSSQIVTNQDAWAAQCGTSLDPEKKYLWPHLVEKQPLIISDGIVTNEFGTQYALVHQYDRVPELNRVIAEKYK